jgi:ribosomal protein L37AE/L43A
MQDPYFDQTVARQTSCPFCRSPIVDTLAKVITVKTFWRCRECERTWTVASLAASAPRAR